MLLNNRLITAAFSVLLFTSYAQQDKLVTHFMFDKMSINPGKTGIDMYNGICATSIYRNQWDKVNGAPNSTVLNIESNLSRFFPGGVGINFYNDAIGFARQNTVLLNYSYPIQIGRIGVLGVGVGMGIMNYGMDPTWVTPNGLPAAQDPSIPTGFAATSFDANFGLYFQAKNYYAGFSTTHLSESDLSADPTNLSLSFQTARHYYLMGGYIFKDAFGTANNIDAQMLVRTDLIKFSVDFNARYMMDLGGNPAYGGLTFRTSDAIALMAGYSPFPNFNFGYSYDININKLASISRGSHEMMVKYCYFLPPPPKTKARHPRWL
jgi:type IX secretion system PorP/SprF family membrane protein